MPDPIIVQRMNAFRTALARQEAAQMHAMTARWLALERSLATSIQAVIAEIARRQANGEAWARHTGPYARLEQYQSLLRQVRAELAQYTTYAAHTIDAALLDYAALGVEHSAAQTALALGDPELAAQFNRLSPPAIENIVAALQHDAPVGQLLRQAWPEAIVRMTDALANGVALGWNPRKTARAMRAGLQRSVLQRALLIARTEQLRAYRTATLENYRASGVIRGYKRLAAKSARTCLACLIADGRVYTLEESFEEHPNGRCTLVPILIDQDAPTWETGRTWLARQPEATQRRILGPAAYDAWRAGAITLDDLVHRHEHPVWGAALQVRSLRSVLGAPEAQRWLRGATSRPANTAPQPRPAHYRPLQDTRLAEVSAMTPQDWRQLRAEMTSARELPKLKEHFRKHGSEFEALGIASPEALNALFQQHIQRMDLRIFTYVSTQPATQYRQWVLVGMDNGVIVVYNESKRRHWSMMRARSITEYIHHQRGWWVEVSDWDDNPKIERQ